MTTITKNVILSSLSNDYNYINSDFIPDIYVYTDGACSNNGKVFASAGIGIYFGDNDPRNISKRIEGKQTNNTAELHAINEVFSIIKNDILNYKKIMIISDSEYAIKCATTYGKKCNDMEWNINIPNKNLVKQLYERYKDYDNIKFAHIKAHTDKKDIHSIGNYNADKLANASLCIDIKKKEIRRYKIYLSVPYEKKEEVKVLGGMWDFKKKKWYIYDDNENKEQIINIFSNEQDEQDEQAEQAEQLEQVEQVEQTEQVEQAEQAEKNKSENSNIVNFEKYKIYISVPYKRKNEAKTLGGLWDSKKKSWYIYNDNKNKEQLLNLFEGIYI